MQLATHFYTLQPELSCMHPNKKKKKCYPKIKNNNNSDLLKKY